MKTKYKIMIGAGIALIILAGGFLLGRSSVKIRTLEKVEYITLDPIHDTIPVPVPYEIKVPIKVDTANLMAYCIDSGLYDYLIPTVVEEKIVYESVDTSKIIQDFVNEVKYDITLFDIDTIGKTQLKASVQYNRLHSISYDFYPVQKQVTTATDYTRRFEPFISAGIGLDNSFNAGAGLFFKNGIGVMGTYRRNFQSKANTGELNVLYKF